MINSRRNRYSYIFDFGSFKITKGEIIILCVAFVIWTTLCVFINMSIKNNTLENNEKYYKAVQIEENEERFKYAMRTNTGNTLTYGEVKVVDVVTIPEITGEYFAIQKVTEKYTKHVTYVEEDGKRVKKETKSWDHYRTDTYVPEKVMFSGVEFPYNKLKVNNFKRLELSKGNVSKQLHDKIHFNRIYESSYIWESVGDLRYYYYVIPLSQKITVFANLKENSMYSINGEKNIEIFYDTIPNIMENMEKFKNTPNIVFTVIWYILFLVLGYFFVYQRNKWADC